MAEAHVENQLKYTEAEMDSIIEKEEADEREKVRQEYAAELARLNKELAEIKNKYEVSSREDMQRVIEQNFQSDACLNEVELQEYRNLLSEFEELESGVVEHHTQLREGRAHAETPDSHQSLQSLSDSFEELQQRYKQLKDDSARKLKTLQEALELKSKLERVNEQLQIKFQSDLEDLRHLADEANLEYSSIQKRLASELAIEKATTKKLEVEAASLEKSVHQMELEKVQLQQFCEDLMKELGSH